MSAKISCNAFLHIGKSAKGNPGHAEHTAKLIMERMSRYECRKNLERESDQAEVQHAVNVETAISIVDVGSLSDLADRF